MPVVHGDMVLVDGWMPGLGGAYVRRQGHIELQGTRARLGIIGYRMAPKAEHRPLRSPQYRVLFDGVLVATVQNPGSSTTLDAFIDVTGMPSNIVEVRIEGDAGECCLPYFAEIVSAVPATGRKFVPVASGSYDTLRTTQGFNWGKVFADYDPRPLPLTPRSPPPLTGVVKEDQLHVSWLVPFKYGDEYRPERTARGTLTSFGAMDYHWSDLVRDRAVTPHLDGERNVGAISMLTKLKWGRNGTLYAGSPHRIARITKTGKIKTLIGWVDDGISTHWQTPERTGRLVGDWSAVPEGRRGFVELWDFDFDPESVEVDPNAAPIINDLTGALEQPHGTGPVLFVADSQRNRIIKAVFSHDRHDQDPVVTEFITGLADPWGVRCVGDEVIVSERKAHRIAAYDKRTGAFLRVVVQGLPLATISAGREVKLLGATLWEIYAKDPDTGARGALIGSTYTKPADDPTREVVAVSVLEQARRAPCVAPEGIDYVDGRLYFASAAQSDIRHVRLSDGGDLKVQASWVPDGNTLFAQISVSPGGPDCLPAGTTGLARWSPANLGYAMVYMPDGTPWPIGRVCDPRQGAGVPHHFVYVGAVAVGAPGIAIGGANEGIQVLTRRIAGEPLISAAVVRGETKLRDSGEIMVHGQGGFGPYRVPLPWGKDPDIDACFRQHGHTQ